MLGSKCYKLYGQGSQFFYVCLALDGGQTTMCLLISALYEFYNDQYKTQKHFSLHTLFFIRPLASDN